MQIRTATPADLAAVTAVEAACFPPAEAAGEADFAARLNAYPEHFWLLECPTNPRCGTRCTRTPPCTMNTGPGR